MTKYKVYYNRSGNGGIETVECEKVICEEGLVRFINEYGDDEFAVPVRNLSRYQLAANAPI